MGFGVDVRVRVRFRFTPRPFPSPLGSGIERRRHGPSRRPPLGSSFPWLIPFGPQARYPNHDAATGYSWTFSRRGHGVRLGAAAAISGLPLLATLAGLGAAGDAMARQTSVGRALTGPVATMLCGAVLVNLSLGEASASVDLAELKVVQTFLVTVSTPLLLMGTNLRAIVKGAGPLVPGFLLGSLGSLLGCALGCALLGDKLSEALLLMTTKLGSGAGGAGEVASDVAGIAAALAAKNIGGGFNFVAVAESSKVSPGTLALGLAADNVAALIYFPLAAFVAGIGQREQQDEQNEFENKIEMEKEDQKHLPVEGGGVKGEDVSAEELTLVLALSGAIVVAVKVGLAAGGNTIAYCSALTILLATVAPAFFERLKAPAYTLARVFLSLFFASAGLAGGKVLGLDGAALLPIAALLSIIYVTHILSVVLAKILFKTTFLESALISNAAIGGPATAAALATSKGVDPTPAVLIGNLGNAIATFAGLAILPYLRTLLLHH